MNRFQINATRWKQLATVVSDCVTVILKHSCLFILVWWRVFLRFLRHKTIVANFLHVMLLICKVFINNFSKGQFVVLFVAVSLWTEFIMLLKYFFYLFLCFRSTFTKTLQAFMKASVPKFSQKNMKGNLNKKNSSICLKNCEKRKNILKNFQNMDS